MDLPSEQPATLRGCGACQGSVLRVLPYTLVGGCGGSKPEGNLLRGGGCCVSTASAAAEDPSLPTDMPRPTFIQDLDSPARPQHVVISSINDELKMQEQPPVVESPPTEANAANEEQPPAEVKPVKEPPPTEAGSSDWFFKWFHPRSTELPQAVAAPDAGAALNADVRLALTALDNRLVSVLGVGDICFVRSSWLLAQPDEYRIQRRQDLETLERSGASPSPLLSPKEAVALVRKGNRSAGILSYGCTLCHGLQLSQVVSAFTAVC